MRSGIPGTVVGCSGNARRATREVAPERRKRVAEHRALSNNIQATSELGKNASNPSDLTL